MEEKTGKTCCFIGHRKIEGENELKDKLYHIVEELIVREHVHTFLFGSKSEFDTLCLKVVTNLKDKYPHIKRIFVRAEFQYINDDYKEYLLQYYEDTFYPEKIAGAGRASYVERNKIMIDSADICVMYYKENYTPQPKKTTSSQPKSGTKIAYEYAKKKSQNTIAFNLLLC